MTSASSASSRDRDGFAAPSIKASALSRYELVVIEDLRLDRSALSSVPGKIQKTPEGIGRTKVYKKTMRSPWCWLSCRFWLAVPSIRSLATASSTVFFIPRWHSRPFIWGLGPSIVAAIVGIIATDWLFVPPIASLGLGRVSDVVEGLTYTGVCALIIAGGRSESQGQAQVEDCA